MQIPCLCNLSLVHDEGVKQLVPDDLWAKPVVPAVCSREQHWLSRMELLTRSGIIVDKTFDKLELASDYFWPSRQAETRSAALSCLWASARISTALMVLSLVPYWNLEIVQGEGLE